MGIIVDGVIVAEDLPEVGDPVDQALDGHTLGAADPFWVRLVSDSRLLAIAEQYIGPDIALFASHYIAKPPGDGMPVLYHQDGAYWETERGWGGGRDPMITIRVIADDEDEENGCMKV